MFRFFADRGLVTADLAELHPAVLEALLEKSWNHRVKDTTQSLGHPEHRSDIEGRPEATLIDVLAETPSRIPPRTGLIQVPTLAADIETFIPDGAALGGIRWKHLIYAYMIENTRITEVFRRVVDNFLHGERLSVLSSASQRWLWTTEELFYRHPPSFSVTTQTSEIRPDIRGVRGNLYQRLFGMTLNTTSDTKPAFPVAEHANVDFVSALDELLHEIWQGRTNFANAVGARPTDDSKISQLCERLSDMLGSRRSNGTLSREEFWAVSAMSWFHGTILEQNHPIILDLRAQASSPEERLFKIAQRVGYPAHGLSKSYFEVAEPLSRLLIAIETGTYNNVAAVPALYTPPTVPPPPGTITPVEDTDQIKTHWSIIRGRDIKSKKVVAN
ncbi:MAG: hypothetical protein ABI647_10350 [Gemmatimonadota bacterium]